MGWEFSENLNTDNMDVAWVWWVSGEEERGEMLEIGDRELLSRFKVKSGTSKKT